MDESTFSCSFFSTAETPWELLFAKAVPEELSGVTGRGTGTTTIPHTALVILRKIPTDHTSDCNLGRMISM